MRQQPVAKPNPNKWNPSQIVAHNMTKARELRGLTQTEVAERLARYTDTKWTKTSVAQAEGSVSGTRVRVFTAVELFALARTFDLPVLYFLAPPEDTKSVRLDLPQVPSDAWDYFVVLIGGHYDNKEILSTQYADYAMSRNVRVPYGDRPDEEPTGLPDAVTALKPTDVYAAAFHGLMLGNQRGAFRPGEELATFIANLKNLVFALESLENYSPGRWVDPQVADNMRAERAERQQAESAEWAEINRERKERYRQEDES